MTLQKLHDFCKQAIVVLFETIHEQSESVFPTRRNEPQKRVAAERVKAVDAEVTREFGQPVG